MERKKYLNEERYQKSKKKLILIAFIILIVGILGGTFLILKGQEKTKENKILVQQRLDAIEIEKENINQKITQKSYECDSMDMWKDDWFANHSKCIDEETKLRVELGKLNSEEVSLEHQDGTAFVYYGLGGICAFIGLIIFFAIFTTAKGREIAAFGAQQMMPIAQEGIDTIAPTVGNAAKEIAKGISKGIKEGKE